MKTLEKTNEDQIRELTQQWLKAVHARDAKAVMACYAEDVIAYDLFTPTKVTGVGDYRKNYEMWFQCCQGPIHYEIKELDIVAGDEVAFCRSLNRMTGPNPEGKEEETWIRATVCFQKRAGAWKVVHEHVSVPLDMESQKGVFQFRD
ncbi:SgcJ/EcaC family oxidoreductase [Luteolibacter sp. Populi]|uniref:YybH family protein n=1 Tax=Luteolibacter sp. Populi TaxID=3230487 RepID=UPI003465A8F6